MYILSKKYKSSEGFTLVELLVVIAIIGVLASLVLLQLGVARGKSRDAKRVADVSQVRTAIELYFDDNGGQYPQALSTTNLRTYMAAQVLPADPLTAAAYFYAYGGLSATRSTQYHLYTELEQRNSSALNADSDLDSTTFTNAGGNTINASNNTTYEACSSSSTTDCVYDTGQR